MSDGGGRRRWKLGLEVCCKQHKRRRRRKLMNRKSKPNQYRRSQERGGGDTCFERGDGNGSRREG